MECINCKIEMEKENDTQYYLGKDRKTKTIPAAIYTCFKCDRKIRWQKKKGIQVINKGSKNNSSEIIPHPLDTENILIPSVKTRKIF